MDFRFSSEDNRFHEKEAKEAFVVESYGSVEGVLEASPCEGEGMFVIRKALNGELVQCHIRDDLIRQAKDALGRRVNVFGEKLVSKDGKSRAISGRKMRVLPRQEDLPPLEFFRGIAPDMTGGLPSEVYVKKRFYGDCCRP